MRHLYRPLAELTRREVADLLREAALHYCYDRRMVASPEVGLPNGRVADVLGVKFGGAVTIIEIKSCRADFATDSKWPDYLAFADYVYFFAPEGACDPAALPPGVGLYELTERAHTTRTGRTTYRRKLVSRRAVRRTGADTRSLVWKLLFRLADRHSRYDRAYPAAAPTLVELPAPLLEAEAEAFAPAAETSDADAVSSTRTREVALPSSKRPKPKARRRRKRPRARRKAA